MRIIEKIVDLETLTTFKSDDLDNSSPVELSKYRKNATKSKREGRVKYVCEKCGFPVYLSNSKNKLYHWKHFSDHTNFCEWYTGKTKTPEKVSAEQYMGKHESDLHKKLKWQIKECLDNDPSFFDVVVEQYIISPNGKRKPDVQAKIGDKKIAFEIQLSHTMLPTIVDREKFYYDEKMNLVWVLWNFNKKPLLEVKQAFLDIAVTQKFNFFYIDRDLLIKSINERRFWLKAACYFAGTWKEDIITVSDLCYDNGLPYYKDRYENFMKTLVQWHEKYAKPRKPLHFNLPHEIKNHFYKLFDALGVSCLNGDKEMRKLIRLLYCVLSLKKNRVLGSGEKEIAHMFNNALDHYGEFVIVLEEYAKQTGFFNLLNRETTINKISEAKNKFNYDCEFTKLSRKIIHELLPLNK